MKVMQSKPQMFFPCVIRNKIPFEDCKNDSESPKRPNKLYKMHPKITKKEFTLLPSNLLDDLEPEQNDNSLNESISNTTFYNNMIHPLFQMETNEILRKIQTHQGSLILQQLIQTLPKEQTEQLLAKLSPILINIMISHYGNYFFQQLLQLLNKQQKLFIFSMIQPNFLSICINKSGTYSIQALIEVMESREEEIALERMLTPILPQLCGNEHGHHIILKLIIVLPEAKRTYINNFILKNLPNISCNKFGHLCIMKFMTSNTKLTLRVEFITQITQNFLCLIQNPFGCTIFLFLIEKYGIRYKSIIFTELLKNMSYFATESNISLSQIEQILFYLNKYDKSKFESMTWELLRDKPLTLRMLNYQNGTRIIYNLLQYASNEQITFFKTNYLMVNCF